jgi:acetyl-CoA carboxylase biotin carboxylase subunit
MIKKILIANRGEIALRIIRACNELGIKTVAVHSEADVHSLHVRFADEDVCIGPAAPQKSYLNINQIISAAIITNADAIHPGYGFLAENADFSDICQSSNIVFIGPSAQMIRNLGDKVYAKKSMKKAGVPVIPGSDGAVESLDQALEIARSSSFPFILKAAAGGGGRGMRIVKNEKELKRNFDIARTEAQLFFGSPQVYLEKFIERPRHIEVQLMGDHTGKVFHMGERDCSIQRRHQKLIEESPSPALTPRLRKKLCEVAVKGAEHIGYQNAGTMEFLMDEDGKFYFMEMNTRVQVEHPVTEEATDIDIIKWQILVSSGQHLGLQQKDIRLKRHAIECRINAEDPDYNFRPCPGTISHTHLPGGHGVRVDTHVYAGYTVTSDYDSMISKLICTGETREQAINCIRRSLEEYVVEGIKTTIPVHIKIMNQEDFKKGDYTTKFLEEREL